MKLIENPLNYVPNLLVMLYDFTKCRGFLIFFFALVFLFSLPAYSNNYANLTLKKALEIAKRNNVTTIMNAAPARRDLDQGDKHYYN